MAVSASTPGGGEQGNRLGHNFGTNLTRTDIKCLGLEGNFCCTRKTADTTFFQRTAFCEILL